MVRRLILALRSKFCPYFHNAVFRLEVTTTLRCNTIKGMTFYKYVTGLVTVFMAQSEMGLAGSYMVLTMLIMAVMSSGSGEVMAISSIIVYDIYQTHIKPFRLVSGLLSVLFLKY